MSITDLTGTKLKFLDVVDLETGNYKINFKSNNQNFTSFNVVDPSEQPVETGYLTFSSDDAFSLTIDSNTTHEGTLEYSTDASSWSNVTKGTAISSVDNKIYLRGSNNTYCKGTQSSSVFTLNGSNIKCEGNIETLLDYQTVLNGKHPVMTDACYFSMFRDCTSLVEAPTLPATTLAKNCYVGMFWSCTSLIQAPELPATTLAEGCYNYMFYNCKSLTTAPTLPATTLAKSCYAGMFCDCTSLTQAPALPATTLADYCYHSMFSGCTSLVEAPALPATTLACDCYYSMFRTCKNLNTLPALPATTLTKYCYYSMFYNCTSIKLSTSKTGEYVNEYRIPYGTATGTTANNALNSMFTATGGTFKSTPEINVTYYTSNEIIK